MPRESPHAIPGRKYGLLSHLRSYFIFDPLIWLYTLILGPLGLMAGFFDRDGSIMHGFARAWSWLIMKTILSPVKVIGLEKIDTTKAHVYASNHASALDIPVLYVNLLSVPHCIQERAAFVSGRRMASEALGAGLH